MICYLDSSALVKCYIPEDGSYEVKQVLSETDSAGTAWISLAEVVAGLAKAARMDVLSSEDADFAIRLFRADWPNLRRFQITESLLERAADLARQHGLRGYDAVQLAAASTWQESLEDRVTLVTFDRQLWQAARKEGLDTRPEKL